MKYLSIVLCLTIVLASCKKKNTQVRELGITPIDECKNMPEYIAKAGFIPGKPFGFSIAEKGAIGLSLVQFPGKGVPYKRFNLPSWSIAGHLGAVVTDIEGSNFVVPRPFINTLKNDPGKQNIVYKVSTETGEMKEFIALAPLNSHVTNNPFGLMGLVYDCESAILYASSVAGSDIGHEAGSIYAISTSDKPEVITTLTGVDAMGLGICYLDGKKNLFFGKARTSEIYRIELNSSGKFSGDPIPVLSLALLGERGDDKPRKIRFTPTGEMNVSGISFNFNLANSADKQENIYTFQHNQEDGKWVLTGIRKGLQ